MQQDTKFPALFYTMYFRLRKQMMTWIVLPGSILIGFSGIITWTAGNRYMVMAGILLLLAAAWLILGGIITNLIISPFRDLHQAVKQQLDNEWIPDSISQSLDEGNLTGVHQQLVEHIQQLKNENQSGKMNRLRAIIDGQDLERQRLARELHDGVGQSLIAVRLGLENAGSLPYSQMRAAIDVAKEMVDGSIDEIRAVTNALMPASLAEFGVIAALRSRCEEMAAVAGMKVIFSSRGSLERLEKKSKMYLYRIAQEAINNAIRHSRAQEVNVTLSRMDDVIELEVVDNGKGFIPDPRNVSARNGIQNMRERTDLLGGKFKLDTFPGTGTRIQVIIPYKTRNGKDSDYSGR